MDTISPFLNKLMMETSGTVLWILLVVAALIFWVLLLTLALWRQMKINRRLIGDDSARSLRKIVLEQMDKVGAMQVDLANVEDIISSATNANVSTVQRIGLVRFSPFEDTGSDQSFVLALLDGTNTGIVLSSLHGRDRTRMYAKKVIKGKCEEYSLSEEEQEAINQAMSTQ
ncbi:DUF4446 family protein [candidate division WWE3 bacterium]|uniref:DUF4446 family protein n=1 Tax=candidate division WWE3 bacterium TaxID=2053526 RepID=A0A955LGM8_UNCKA|nr:DUF4446 family protein [candidate division WWE3 bacterium]